MKTTIEITGSGINSKNTLLSACQSHNSEVRNLNFNNYAIDFQTKKDAVKALSKAYQSLHSDIEDWNNSCADYTRGTSLSYDAGIAKIVS